MTGTAGSIILRAALLLVCGAGVFSVVLHRKNGFMNVGGLLYYTIQSNLAVLLTTAVYLAYSLIPAAIPRALDVLRFVVLVGITVTFLGFWALLAPFMEKEYLLSINNLLVHTLAPILFALDFFLFDRSAPIAAAEVPWATAMPLFYFIFSITHAAVNPNLRFQDGSRYPYFFLDLDKYGWFGFRRGLGVFWWALFFMGLTLGLGYLYRFLQTVL